jgi:hypothetical protein
MRSVSPDNPKLKRFIESGDLDKANTLEGVAYHLFSVANALHEEAMETMQKHGFVNHELKQATNRLMQAFDWYNTNLNRKFPETADRSKFCKTYETLDQLCRQAMNPQRNVVYVNLERNTLTDETDKDGVMCLRLDIEDNV